MNAGLSHCELKCESATADLTSTQSFSYLPFFQEKGRRAPLFHPLTSEELQTERLLRFLLESKPQSYDKGLKTATSSLIYLPTQSASLSYSDVCHNTTAAAGSGPASAMPHLENSAERIHYPSTFTVINRNFVHSCFFFSFLFFPPTGKNFDFSKIKNTITPKCPV